jgi:two-component sensor histidine kinase
MVALVGSLVLVVLQEFVPTAGSPIILQLFHLCAVLSSLLCAVLIKSQRDRTLLIGDLDHRMKNLFTTLQMVAYNTAQTSDTFDGFIERYTERIDAISRYHRLLTAGDYQTVYFDRLIAHMLLPHFRQGRDKLLDVTTGIVLPGKAAQALGMALNELATNAAKYGGLATPAGRVTVRCFEYRQNGKVWLGVIWMERNGAIKCPVQKQGFGTMLVKASFEDQLNGRVVFEFRKRGLRVEASFPAPSASS